MEGVSVKAAVLMKYRWRESRSDNENHVERRYLENKIRNRERKKQLHLHPISFTKTKREPRKLTSCWNHLLVRHIVLAAQKAHPPLNLPAIRKRHTPGPNSYPAPFKHDKLLKLLFMHKARSHGRDDRFPELPPPRSTASRRGSSRSDRSSRRRRSIRCRCRRRRLRLTHQHESLSQRL